jgi:hypothetical protein
MAHRGTLRQVEHNVVMLGSALRGWWISDIAEVRDRVAQYLPTGPSYVIPVLHC